MDKRVITYSYYSPEEITGIGKYNGEMLDWLVQKKVNVTSISNAPFYPYWKLYKGFKNPLYTQNHKKYLDIRTYVYIPESPGALKKIISELTFTFTSFFALLGSFNAIRKADLFIVINPPFFLGFYPLILCKILRTPILFHVQDLQVDAAKELNLLPVNLCKILEVAEKFLLNRADYISTISVGMMRKIKSKKVNKQPLLIKNWADLNQVYPKNNVHWLHKELSLSPEKKLIVYSGNIGEKQGLEIILDAAENLKNESDLHFIILGEGLYKQKLQEKIDQKNLNNLTLGNLVAKEYLNDMLNSSHIQLVIQKSLGADSFLPSKLTNILASGSCAIVTADKGTSLYEILHPASASMVIQPDSSESLIYAIMKLTNNEELKTQYCLNARKLAEEQLGIDGCLKPLVDLL